MFSIPGYSPFLMASSNKSFSSSNHPTIGSAYPHERFSDVYKKKSSKGNVSLRRWQLKSAEKGNVTMQIWLGKQHLGQKEKFEVESETGNGVLTNLVEALNNAKKS